MKKNLLTLLIILLSAVCSGNYLSAHEHEIDTLGTWGGIDWTLTTDGTLIIAPTVNPITKKKPWSGELYQVGEWPAAVNDAITSVTGWPYDRAKVKKLIIEEGVISIGSFAAQSFTNLTGEVVIPSTVTYIGQEAFQNSTMSQLTFAEGGTKELCIAPGAFKKLIITELELPYDRPKVHVHCWVFQYCSKLENVIIPANVIFGGWTHADYYGMDYVWGKYANSSDIFADCPKLETIVFGSDEVRTKFLAAQGNKSTINKIGATVALQGPVLKASEMGLYHITLSWDAVDGAIGYKVYQGDALVYTSQTETTFTANNLSSNTEYCFSVSTIYETEEESAKSEICVTTLQPVAKVGSTEYATISDAYTAANDNDVIYIIKDFEEEGLEITKTDNITIDFNNHKYTATSALTVIENNTITLQNGTITSNADYVISTNGNLIINNMTIDGTVEYLGGDLFTDQTFNIVAKKYFAGIGNVVGKNWSTISTPIADAAIPEATAGIHDLYRYNEEKELWEYYKDDGNSENGVASNPFTTLELGRGYLYANAEDITLELEGKLNASSIGPISLNYTVGNKFAGFDFIGNPFTHTITRSNITTSPSQALSTGFYVVGANGTWIAKTDSNDKIAPMESVLIKANGPGDLIIHSNNGSKREARNEDSYISVNVASKTHSDVTHISFNEGMGLDKISHRNPDNPMIYIPVDGKDYAIAMMSQDVKEVPVHFNANRMAEYTISIEQKNCEFSSVVLVDKLTGIETNLLIEDYSFMARTFDNADRFIIRLSIEDNSDSESENFAFISNGQMIIEEIEGQGLVRIFDVMGRHIAQHSVSGSASIATDGLATGMYIIQMADDNGVKVQKIIID